MRPTPPQPVHPARMAKRLDELAAKKGVSKSSIVAAALASWLSPDAADQRRQAIAVGLIGCRASAERLERDQNIQIERWRCSSATSSRSARQFPGAPRRSARPGAGALRAVRGAVGPPPAAWAQPGARRGGGTASPTRCGWMNRRRPKRRSVRHERVPGLHRHVARPPCIQMLRTAMGPLIAAALKTRRGGNHAQPDRTLGWIGFLGARTDGRGAVRGGRQERIIRPGRPPTSARRSHRGQPLLTAELPETGERFEGILPPAAPGPAFALRKPRHRRDSAGAVRHRRDDDQRSRRAFSFAPCASGNPDRRRHQHRQDHAHQCAAGRIAATGDRVLVLEHGGAAMRGPRPRRCARGRASCP